MKCKVGFFSLINLSWKSFTQNKILKKIRVEKVDGKFSNWKFGWVEVLLKVAAVLQTVYQILVS